MTTTRQSHPSLVVTSADRASRRAVAISFAIQGALFASLAARLPVIKDRYELSDFGVLAVLAAMAAGSAVGSLLAGLAAERWGSARVVRSSQVAACVAAVLAFVPDSRTLFIAGITLVGALIGAIDATQNMQGVAVQERYGRSLMTSFYAVYSLAVAIGAASASLTAGLDWSLAAAVAPTSLLGVALVLVFLGSLLGPDADPLEHHHAEVASAEAAPAPAWRPILLIAVPTFAMWVADSATNVWSGIYLEDGLGATAEVAPLAIAAYQLLVFVVRVIGDRLVERFGAETVVRGSGWTAVAALVLVVAAPGVPVVLAAFALLGVGLSLIPPLAFVAAAHHDPDNADRAVARVNVANYVGYIVAAFGIAVVAEGVSHRAMFVVPLVLVALIPLMARQFQPQKSQPQRD